MAILADFQYTLEQYKIREDEGNIKELELDIIAKINKLATRVGAPSYQKTPVFKRNYYKESMDRATKIGAAQYTQRELTFGKTVRKVKDKSGDA